MTKNLREEYEKIRSGNINGEWKIIVKVYDTLSKE